MRFYLKKLLFLALLLGALAAGAQPVAVTKTNPQTVYMHYMPWFETPATNSGKWGLHWTMANQNPNIIDPTTGQRQIASHYYPLIGPYASSDPDVLEYHLLLMKYAGVDGVLIDYYGQGGNDLPLLLRNTNALVPRTADVGLSFAVVFEDQFATTLAAATANMKYVGDNYFSRPNYAQAAGKPLVLTFGPQKYQTPAAWTQILGALPTPPTFLTLWYQSQQAGSNAAGEFSWIYSDSTRGLTNFDVVRSARLGFAGGSAWPGFNSFYAQGGWAGPTWKISRQNASGPMLTQTLTLASQYQSHLGFVQLVTMNDFGEGTQLEPTKENGFTDLVRVQQFTGVPYTETELRLVYQLYLLRKQYAGNTSAQTTLDQAFQALVKLDVPTATTLLGSLGQPLPTRPGRGGAGLQLYPNPAQHTLRLASTLDLSGGTVQVFDALGRVVLTQPSQPSLDISTLAPGAYRLVLSKGDTRLSEMFVK